MPTYEYECNACGHGFEHYQSITDAKLRKCPECGKFKLQRLIGSGAGVIFKGSGFYETDYKSKSAPAASGSEKPETKPCCASPETCKAGSKAKAAVKDA